MATATLDLSSGKVVRQQVTAGDSVSVRLTGDADRWWLYAESAGIEWHPGAATGSESGLPVADAQIVEFDALSDAEGNPSDNQTLTATSTAWVRAAAGRGAARSVLP